MASFWYDIAAYKLASGDLDFDTVDLRAKLVMTNTTCDTQKTAATLAAFSTIDEYDGSGYSGATLGTATVTNDGSNHRTNLDVADWNFGATVAAGSRQAQGILVFAYVDGNTSHDWPVMFIDDGGFPFSGNGGQISVTVDATGLARVAP